MNREQGLQELERTRIIAILRGVKPEAITRTAQALLAGGVTVMEVTLNSAGALDMIRELQQTVGSRMYIGAGTVLDLQDAHDALDAGAAFLVTPNTDEEVIRFAVQQNIPVFPGAMTPTEIVKAWKAGAHAVKIFPSTGLGLPYIRELMGPLNAVPMVAVGGVTARNVADFLGAGCCAVGIGSSICKLGDIEAGRYDLITENARAFTSAVTNWREAAWTR
ncbi:bifunctional 4-hydroxy-2-oxoglutarate aldolase/2-dehydro-3-deoxy-phosphogluconate aldolase [Paenibacillus lutrae]|uniref:Bifunctional 4-hydroxy-2-oxoglutarate aldolase/2-dehydro-3-deoxy-phosphogluconate aldolase n=1 Tax=Paenibacillus lutrae TaxID=2078573 RepID=A0A7X3FF09_9BACL|nr:bifunctional 4-hydroxy-2-oxoglutarate aldolase/2-dehydro-3-deoxy-phosphogluconate aldolase [Paenibacillus lutrae]MVO98452.1 bifunctional 4-hydroxy-2-oxoglutarate aldolase/2-dehydro-3-deoxy-phosphogluconate aldolase [Paenibacillus lutrae]